MSVVTPRVGQFHDVFFVTHDPARGRDTPLGVVLLNAGLIHSVGPFRFYAELAEQLASEGFHAARLDQSGRGESSIREGGNHSENIKADLAEVKSHLLKQGVSKIVLLGICSGADDALACCDDPDVCGLILLDGFALKTLRFRRILWMQRLTPTRVASFALRQLKRLIALPFNKRADEATRLEGDLRNWPDLPQIRSMYLSAFQRGVRVLSLFTGGIDYYNYAGQLAHGLSLPMEISTATKNSGKALLTEHYLPESGHILPTVGEKREVQHLVMNWLHNQF